MIAPDYSQANAIKELKIPPAVTIVGTGGTGSWVALLSAIAGVKRFVMFDGSQVKPTDLARLPLTSARVGDNKVESVKALMRDYRPDISVSTYPRRFVYGQDEHLIEGVLFNCADNIEAADKLSEYAAAKSIPYISAPYGPMSAAVFDHRPSTLILSGQPVPCWVGCGALAASLAVTSAFGNWFNTVVCPRGSAMDKPTLAAKLKDALAGEGSM